jgi:hypothetical protein
MKKLHVTLIALFTLFAVQAQTVTEASLLGEWTPKKIMVEGTTIDFKTGDVTLSAEAASEIEASGEDVEEVKTMIKEGMGSADVKNIRVLFKKGLIAEFHKGESVKNLTYTLSDKNGVTHLMRSDGKTMSVALKDGLLQLVPEGEAAGGPSIYFEKTK